MDLMRREVKNRVETLFFPKRIVKVFGGVTNPENLLGEKEIITTFNETRVTRFEKKPKERTFVLIDLGKEIHGSAKIVVTDANCPTAKFRLTFGESVSEALSSIGDKNATNDHSPRDFEVVLSRLSVVEYAQTGYRFLKIEMLSDDCWMNVKSVVGVCKTENFKRKGYIKTSDPLLDEIFETAVYTCFINMQDGLIWDGIKRDRLVWAGDLNSEILTSSYMYGTTVNIKNSLQILKDTTPNNVWMNGIPTYSAWWVLNLCDYYRLSGDEAYFAQNIGYVNQILADFDGCISENGEMNFAKTGKSPGLQFYLDWPSCETPDAVFGTAMLISYTMQKLLNVGYMGIEAKRAKSIIKKLQIHIKAPVTFKQVLAMQVLCGADKQKARAALEKDGAAGYTTFMSYALFTALFETGSNQVLNIIKEFYGGMLSRGATTFWEDFDVSWLEGSGRIDEEPKEGEKDIHGDYGNFCYRGLRHSLCHGWSCGVAAFMVEKLVGLEVLDPGFKRVRIKPNLCGLKHLKAKIPTPYGAILVQCNQKGTKITLPEHIELIKE